MRRFFRAGLILCLAALPMASACMTPPTSSFAPSSAPIGSSAATPPATNSQPIASQPAPEFDPSGYKVDSAESKALTDYLKQHKLPLVGAQVMQNADGQRGVMLYGYVGSNFGKQDAVVKARNFLNDQALAVNNAVKVQPELLASSAPAHSSASSVDNSADSSATYPGAESYTQHQQSEAQQYVQNQNKNAALSTMAPALILGMMALSMMSSGSGFSVGGGSLSPGYSSFGGTLGSPFGRPPGAYPGYPAGPPPYSPFGPSPFSPFGP